MTAGSLAPVFSALADETRWTILTSLGEQPASASALARALPVSRQAIVKHLDVLTDVGLVTAERRGRELIYTPLGHRLDEVARDLEQIGAHWDRQLGLIKRLAEGGT